MPGQSTCKDCGVEIWWHRSKNDRTYPPLVRTNKQVLVLVDGVMHTTFVWDRHHCDQADIDAFNAARMEQIERAEREHEAYEQRTAIRELVEATRAENYQLAMTRGCTKCGAEVGEPCENLTQRQRGKVIYTADPHLERLRPP